MHNSPGSSADAAADAAGYANLDDSGLRTDENEYDGDDNTGNSSSSSSDNNEDANGNNEEEYQPAVTFLDVSRSRSTASINSGDSDYLHQGEPSHRTFRHTSHIPRVARNMLPRSETLQSSMPRNTSSIRYNIHGKKAGFRKRLTALTHIRSSSAITNMSHGNDGNDSLGNMVGLDPAPPNTPAITVTAIPSRLPLLGNNEETSLESTRFHEDNMPPYQIPRAYTIGTHTTRIAEHWATAVETYGHHHNHRRNSNWTADSDLESGSESPRIMPLFPPSHTRGSSDSNDGNLRLQRTYTSGSVPVLPRRSSRMTVLREREETNNGPDNSVINSPLPRILTMTSVQQPDGGDMETGIADDLPPLRIGREYTNDLRNIDITFNNTHQRRPPAPNPFKHLIKSKHNFRALVTYGGYMFPINILLNVILLGRGWLEYNTPVKDRTIVENPIGYWISSVMSLVLIAVSGFFFVLRCLEFDVLKTTSISITANFANAALILASAIIYSKNERPRHPNAHLTGEFYSSYAGAAVAIINALLLLLDMLITPGFRFRGSGMSRQQRILQFNIILIVVWIGIGGYIWAEIEDWDTIESIMFCMITVTTIGFGNVSPQKEYSRGLQLIYGPIGILMFGMMVLHTRNVVLQIVRTKVKNARRELQATREKLEQELATQRVKRRLAARPVPKTWKDYIYDFIERIVTPRRRRIRMGIPHWLRKKLDEHSNDSDGDNNNNNNNNNNNSGADNDNDLVDDNHNGVQMQNASRLDQAPRDLQNGPNESNTLQEGQEIGGLLVPNANNLNIPLQDDDGISFSAANSANADSWRKPHAFNTLSTGDTIGERAPKKERTKGEDAANDAPPFTLGRSYTTTNGLSQIRQVIDMPGFWSRLKDKLFRRRQDDIRDTRSIEEGFDDLSTSYGTRDTLSPENRQSMGNNNVLEELDEKSDSGKRKPKRKQAVNKKQQPHKKVDNPKASKTGGIRPITKQLWIALALNICFWCISSGIFVACEHDRWTYFDAMYFCYVAFTTIGYGDMVPESTEGMIAFISLCFVAVALETFLVISSIGYFSDLLGRAMGRTRMQRRIDKRRRKLAAYEIRRHIKHPNYNPFSHDEDDRAFRIGIQRLGKAGRNVGKAGRNTFAMVKGKKSINGILRNRRGAKQRRDDDSVTEGFIRQVTTGMGGFSSAQWQPDDFVQDLPVSERSSILSGRSSSRSQSQLRLFETGQTALNTAPNMASAHNAADAPENLHSSRIHLTAGNSVQEDGPRARYSESLQSSRAASASIHSHSSSASRNQYSPSNAQTHHTSKNSSVASAPQ